MEPTTYLKRVANTEKPSNQPGHWRKGPGRFEGWRPIAGEQTAIIIELPWTAYRRDARCKRAARKKRNAPPHHPRTKGKTQGKRGKGHPTNPETKKKTPLGQKKHPKKSTKHLGKHFLEQVQHMDVAAELDRGQLERKNKSSKNTKKIPKNNILELLS